MTQNISVNQIESFLAQTQCGECGFHRCAPYADALYKGEAEINLCRPGGERVIKDLADLLDKEIIPPAKSKERAKIAIIDESQCIGCTMCIKACPTDTIIGAPKQSHTVLIDDCTGCGMCVPPCPADCIEIVFAPDMELMDKSQEKERAIHVGNLFNEKNKRIEDRRDRKVISRKVKIESIKKTGAEERLSSLLSSDKLAKIQAARDRAKARV